MAKGPTATSFKILRILFIGLLLVSVAVYIYGIVDISTNFRQLSQWKDDDWRSRTYETEDQITARTISTALEASVIAFGLLNLIFGLYGAISLRIGSVLIFTILAIICTVLSITQLCYDREPDISISWFVVQVLEIIIAIMMIRKLKGTTGTKPKKPRHEEEDE